MRGGLSTFVASDQAATDARKAEAVAIRRARVIEPSDVRLGATPFRGRAPGGFPNLSRLVMIRLAQLHRGHDGAPEPALADARRDPRPCPGRSGRIADAVPAPPCGQCPARCS